MSDDLESRRIRANEARQLAENRLFREAFDGVAEYLNQAALTCDPDNKDKAQRIVISQQLLQAVKREVHRVMEDGEVAAQMQELEPKRGILRRLVR